MSSNQTLGARLATQTPQFARVDHEFEVRYERLERLEKIDRHQVTFRDPDNSNMSITWCIMPGSGEHQCTMFFGTTQCPAAYATPSLLKDHVQTMHDKRPWICSTCPQLSDDKSNAKRHARTHIPAQYKCRACDKTGRRDNIKRHMQGKTHNLPKSTEPVDLWKQLGAAIASSSTKRLRQDDDETTPPPQPKRHQTAQTTNAPFNSRMADMDMRTFSFMYPLVHNDNSYNSKFVNPAQLRYAPFIQQTAAMNLGPSSFMYAPVHNDNSYTNEFVNPAKLKLATSPIGDFEHGYQFREENSANDTADSSTPEYRVTARVQPLVASELSNNMLAGASNIYPSLETTGNDLLEDFGGPLTDQDYWSLGHYTNQNAAIVAPSSLQMSMALHS